MMDCFIVKEEKNSRHASKAILIENPKSLKEISHETSLKILKLLSSKSMYPAQIAKELKLKEQKVYYHIANLASADFIEIVERKEVRGTIAKKFRAKAANFALSFDAEWKPFSQSIEMDKSLANFLNPFIKDAGFNARFVVGSPDPHGPFKAYARDGHYAIELGMFLGQFCRNPHNFAVMLDVDVKREKEMDNNLVIFGGPVTNIVMSEINSLLPVRFSDKKPWGIISEKTGKKYTNDSIGIIAKVPNPHFPSSSILVIAGIRFLGTKAAVMALTQNHKQILQTYTGQKSWATVIEGFDLDGDGKIDNIEVLE
jgi:DNA-binding transcriptional ArsR family regulator